MLNILHVVAGDLGGGAARGALWLHKALLSSGVNSLVLNNAVNDTQPYAGVRGIFNSKFEVYATKIKGKLGSAPKYWYKRDKTWLFSTGFGGCDITRTDEYKNADIVHLHWINGFISTKIIGQIDKPVIWTLRDMWPLTGGCHYSMECLKYTTGCGACPQLGSDKSPDLSQFIVSKKIEHRPKRLTLVGISPWITKCAKESSVFRGCDCRTINNSIDTSLFFPVDKAIARARLKLPSNKKIVLIGSQSLLAFYKGADLALAALKAVTRSDIHIVLFGSSGREFSKEIQHGVTDLGFLASDESIRLAYSAADVFIAPSRMEAFGKTIVEAMSCGTPVVCFDATGPSSIVRHLETGFKAVPFAPSSIADGMDYILSLRTQEYLRMCRQARHEAVTKYDSSVVVRQYIDLYNEMECG